MENSERVLQFVRQAPGLLKAKCRSKCVTGFEDNEGAINLAEHLFRSVSSENVVVRHHYLKELVARKEIKLTKASTEKQRGDTLKKGVRLETIFWLA